MKRFVLGSLIKTTKPISVDNLHAEDTEHNENEYFVIIDNNYRWNGQKCYRILSQKTGTISPWCHETLNVNFVVIKEYD